MAGERTPILPSTAPSPAADPRHRAAFIVAAVVALATLAVVVLNVAANFSSSPAPAIAATTGAAPADAFTPTVLFPADAHGRRELLQYCEEKYMTQNLNQFVAGGEGTYQQRYFICGKQFFNKENGTIFFYNGNEADVLLYLNNTGLMWENAEEFNALMVFAEHRYFGKSIPFADDVLSHMEYLSSTQALADFAVLIEFLKEDLDVDVPVIGFGGSYGGMLGTWFRLKYPHLMDGVIAGSAPVLHFVNDPDHPVDAEAFQRVVTFDMSEAAGSSANCIPNARKASATLILLGGTEEGRKTIGEVLQLCDPESVKSQADAEALIYSTVGAFGSLAMGNYPYPSSYMTEGAANLPAYPVRAACEHLAPDFADDDSRGLLGALRDAVGVFYNASGDMKCYFPSASPSDKNQTVIDIGNFWGYIECSELYMPMSSDGINDVFPPQPYNTTVDDKNCMATWGVHLRPNWAVTQYGGLEALRSASNIVFSNGNYDPWSGTGVLETLSETVVAVPIDGGAHHVDLFFKHPMDPLSLTQARETEKFHMRKWIREFYEHKSERDAKQ